MRGGTSHDVSIEASMLSNRRFIAAIALSASSIDLIICDFTDSLRSDLAESSSLLTGASSSCPLPSSAKPTLLGECSREHSPPLRSLTLRSLCGIMRPANTVRVSSARQNAAEEVCGVRARSWRARRRT